MAQLSDDCFAFGGELMPAADALARLAETTHTVAQPEEVSLSQAHGRVLAGDVLSTRDVPPHDNAAVDAEVMEWGMGQGKDAEVRATRNNEHRAGDG